MTRQPFPKLLRPFVALLLAIATIPVVAAPSFAQEAKKCCSKTYRAKPGIILVRAIASTSSTCLAITIRQRDCRW